MSQFSKLLIANRGEIALRVIRGAKRMGYATVAVYSDADRDAPHVWAADEAVRLGPAQVGESYLVIDKIIEAAKSSGADAIHPGYGFLAENANFARACEQAGITFIGPTADAIDLMGSKRAAKIRMIAAGVPCVPGYEGEDQSDENLIAKAKEIGCPIMVKASAGGGGRGMRLVEDESKLAAAIKSARSEAENAFGSGELILEKAVVNARHVEIQVFADTQGNVVHLGERDCSVQRRHQKVVEEAPSPAVDAALRQRMGQAAVDAAAAINYRGAGTVEFLLDPSGEFYFMEMNTRLQVEHPVTEMITGQDLVEWQLRVAEGEALPLKQEEIAYNGHAIEVRLCAEDPEQDFLPQTGKVLRWSEPAGDGIRIDHCLQQGAEISPFYDSMQGKVIAWGPDRYVARCRLIKALQQAALLGVVSNKDFLVNILEHEAFAGGEFDTQFIDTYFPRDAIESAQPPAEHIALAAVVLFHADAARLQSQAGLDSHFGNWRSANNVPITASLSHGDKQWVCAVSATAPNQYTVALQDRELHITITSFNAEGLHYVCEGVQGQATYARADNALWLDCEGATWVYQDDTLKPPASAEAGGDGRVLASMDGKILAVNVSAGDQVAKGDNILVLEAMKMEFQVSAAVNGQVEEVNVAAGDQVSARQLLVAIKPEEAE
ncbi:MAG: acetyl-CoA carboxylase biotin carboxylase subunit [Nevskiales bacterium]